MKLMLSEYNYCTSDRNNITYDQAEEQKEDNMISELVPNSERDLGSKFKECSQNPLLPALTDSCLSSLDVSSGSSKLWWLENADSTVSNPLPVHLSHKRKR